VECASTYKNPPLRAHLLTLSQASHRPCVRLFQSSLDYYATTTIDQISRKIYATVPQCICSSSNFFCKDTTRTDLLPVVPIQDARTSLARQGNAKQHVPCYRLAFPLYVAVQSQTASKAIKQYAIQQLHFMADITASRVRWLLPKFWNLESAGILGIYMLFLEAMLCLLAKAGAEVMSLLLFTSQLRPETYGDRRSSTFTRNSKPT
jgi:hypothetical protein